MEESDRCSYTGENALQLLCLLMQGVVGVACCGGREATRVKENLFFLRLNSILKLIMHLNSYVNDVALHCKNSRGTKYVSLCFLNPHLLHGFKTELRLCRKPGKIDWPRISNVVSKSSVEYYRIIQQLQKAP